MTVVYRRHVAPWLVFPLAALTGCASSGSSDPTLDLEPVEVTVTPEAAAATITADEMLAHITFLASDELAGRDTPSPGLEQAALYIARAFQDAGLQPGGDPGSYLQRWDYVKTTLRTEQVVLAYATDHSTGDFAYATDFFLLPAEAETVSAPVVFLGSIDDLLQGVPDGVEGKAIVVTTPPSVGMELLSAIRSAGQSGAAALLMILDPRVPAEVIAMVAGQITGSGLPLQDIPAAGMTWDAGASLFAAGGADLEALATTGDRATVAGLSAEISAPLDRETSTPPNVIGILPGSDAELGKTFVVLSAHFDHVGIGQPDAAGDSIYNGADDDASGTSVLLEVAEALQALPRPPARSIVFLAVSGEEKGLLGSGHFVESPTIPLDNVIANVNLDMVGRNAPDTLIAIGQEYTTLGPLASEIARSHPDLGLSIGADPDPSEQAFFRSDHLVFVKRGIPALFFTSWEHEDYHQPSDEAENIDADKAARVARLAFLLTWAIADSADPPAWNEGALEEVGKLLEMSPF